jgi:hypothetical protein
MARRQLNQKQTAGLISMKPATMSNKIAHPNTFNLGELRELAKKFGWTAEEAGKMITVK